MSSDSNLPRDADGAIDYVALAHLLNDTQSLQDQADILYILFKDKSVFYPFTYAYSSVKGISDKLSSKVKLDKRIVQKGMNI